METNPSPLLMNALALLGTCIKPPMMQHAGSAEYYRRAKILFYEDETDHIVCLQSVLLFFWWGPPTPNLVNKDAVWWWTGLAIKYAQQLGLHREPKTVQDLGGGGHAGPAAPHLVDFVCTREAGSIYQGRPCTIDPEDCTVREPSLDDFPSPVDPRAQIFIPWVRLCGIVGRIGQHLSRNAGHSFPTTLAYNLVDWVRTLPSELKLRIDSRRTRPFSRDVHKLHLPYLTTITILHMSPVSQHPQQPQQPLPEAYTPAITAASCVARIFKDLLARGQIRFLGAIAIWYVGVALVALLSTHLWPIAIIFIRGFERLKVFEALDDTTQPFATNETNQMRGGNPGMPASHAPSNANAGDDHENTSPGLSNLQTMHEIDWRSYFPFVTEETSALAAEILAIENQMDSFLGDDFWYADPSLTLQDIFKSANALDPLLIDGGLPF